MFVIKYERGFTYDLVLHVSVELVNFSRCHQEVPAVSQRLQELLELPLHQLPPPVHLVSVLHLLTQSLHLALQLHHLPLTHLHLVLQHLQGGRTSQTQTTATNTTAYTSTDTTTTNGTTTTPAGGTVRLIRVQTLLQPSTTVSISRVR